MLRTYQVEDTLLDEYVSTLEGTYLDERHYDLLISHEDADVLKPDGTPLLMLRHRALEPSVCRRAYEPLLRAAKPSVNRGVAAGGRYRRIRQDGTRSNTLESKPVLSGIIGYYERTARVPFCRKTAYTSDDVAGWEDVQPFVRAVDAVFRETCPERYAAQMAAIKRTRPEYVIRGTAFTTVTVNRNYRTTAHTDKGDLKEGFGVMSVLRAGEYDGCYLIFPKYRVAVDMRSRDVCLADVHEYHGNSALVGTEGRYERISTVFYYRTRMRECLAPHEEAERAKSLPGDAKLSNATLSRRSQ